MSTDWQALQDGLKAWFAAASGIDALWVRWAGEPDERLEYPYAELQLRTHAGEGVDEVRDVALGDVLGAEAIGLRRRVLFCRVVSRDQSANEKAYTYLERVRTRLALPASQAAFSALGIGLRECGVVTDLLPVRTLREESEAVLEITLNAVSSETDTAFDRGLIEHVRQGGTAHSGSTTITVPDTTTPPLP